MLLRTLFEAAPRALSLLPPEEAHELALKALELGIFPHPAMPDHPSLAVRFAGLAVPNPVGVAAGFDKNARVPDALLALGCGFAEVGTVTPRAQSGNPRPRIFRLPADRAVINRLGFNNEGYGAALERLSRRAKTGIVGVNIGANRDSTDRNGDYVQGIDAFYDVASYFVINISSPNTPGLRDLQAPAALDSLLTAVMKVRAEISERGRPKRPIVVKLTCDIAEEDLAGVIETIVSHGADAIAVSNTTLSRRGLTDAAAREAAREAGGLSGRPLFQRSTAMLARIYRATGGSIPLIGIGGIDCGEAALAKIKAGATLLQLYTGLIYEGLPLIERIKGHLVGAVRSANAVAVSDLVGKDAEYWSGLPLAG
jgi:dihydroorotate dehydrogenase